MAHEKIEGTIGPGPASSGGGGGKTSDNIHGDDGRYFPAFLNFLGKKAISTRWKRMCGASSRMIRPRRVGELESSLALHQARLDALEKVVEQLRNQLGRSKGMRDGPGGRTYTVKEETERLRLQLERARQEKKYAAKELWGRERTIEAQRSALEQYESRLSLRDSQVNALNKESEQLRHSLDQSRNEKQSIAKELHEGKGIIETQRSALEEYESRLSLQDARVSSMKKELERLRILLDQSQQEKKTAVKELQEENEIIESQRSALEEYLVGLNKSAGSLREPAPFSGSCVGEAPIWAVQMAALREENEALKLSVGSLRQSFAMLEEEKRMDEEEVETMATRLPFSKTGSRGYKRHYITPAASSE